MKANTKAGRPMAKQRANGAGGSGAQSRRDELLEVAADVFARHGFQSATVRDIGDAAGILSGSLYHHFRSKEQILEELLTTYLEGLAAEYQEAADAHAPADEVFAQMVTVGLRTVARDRPLAQIVHNDYAYLIELDQFHFVTDYYRAIQKLWLDVIRRGQAEGTFRPDLEPEAVFRVVMGSLLSSIRWYPQGKVRRVPEAAQEVAQIFLGGVLQPAD